MRFLAIVVTLLAVVPPAGDDPLERKRAELGSEGPADRITPPAADRYELPRHGLSVRVPDGWRVVTKPLTNCTDPVQRLALRGRGALVEIVERVGPASVREYPARPWRFTLPGRARWIACCAPRDGKGWMFPFRDGGRAFYAYVYLGAPGTRAESLGVLRSLRVQPRR